jgi:hypothetical protein
VGEARDRPCQNAGHCLYSQPGAKGRSREVNPISRERRFEARYAHNNPALRDVGGETSGFLTRKRFENSRLRYLILFTAVSVGLSAGKLRVHYTEGVGKFEQSIHPPQHSPQEYVEELQCPGGYDH